MNIFDGVNLGWEHAWKVQSPLTNAQAFAFKRSSDYPEIDQNKVLAKNIVVGMFVASPLKGAAAVIQITAAVVVGLVSFIFGAASQMFFGENAVSDYGMFLTGYCFSQFMVGVNSLVFALVNFSTLTGAGYLYGRECEVNRLSTS